MLFSLSCATSGPPANGRATHGGEELDVRLDEMTELFSRIDEAERRGELHQLQREIASSGSGPWGAVRAAFAEIPTDPDGAWSRLREVTVGATGPRAAVYWAWLGMADIALGWGIHDQAAIHVSRALVLAPGSIPATGYAGLLACATGREDEGRSKLQSVVGAPAGQRLSPRFAMELARLEVRDGRVDSARDLLEASLTHHPRHVATLELLATLAEGAGDLAGAARHLEAAAEASPGRPEIAVRVASLREISGDDEGAFEAWRVVSSRRPQDVEPWRRQAALAAGLGMQDEEMAALEKVLQLDPEDPAVVRRLAVLRTESGRFDVAREAWDEVLVRNPDDRDALLARARISIRQDRLREAIGDLRRVASPESVTSGDGLSSEAENLLQQISGQVGLTPGAVTGRSPDAVYAAVSRIVDRAYSARLTALPALGGTFSVRVVVAGGRVVESEVVDNSLHDPVLEALIYWTIRDARFPVAERAREFTLPFTLTPVGR